MEDLERISLTGKREVEGARFEDESDEEVILVGEHLCLHTKLGRAGVE